MAVARLESPGDVVRTAEISPGSSAALGVVIGSESVPTKQERLAVDLEVVWRKDAEPEVTLFTGDQDGAVRDISGLGS